MTRVSNIVGAAILVAVAVAGSLFFYKTNGVEVAPSPEDPVPKGRTNELRLAPGAPHFASIAVRAVEEFPLPLAEPLNGRIAYDENATTRVSSPIPGRIISISALPGDAVNSGDTLLVMNSPDLAQAVSDLAKAHAGESRSRQAYERAKLLLDGGVVPHKDFESAEADFAQARAETQRAETRLRTLNSKLDADDSGRFTLRAPLGGVIAERQANPGMEIRPDLQNPLFVITDPTRLWVIIDLPERNLSKVAIGHAVSVEVDAYPGVRYSATIQRVGQTVDPATRRVQVRCAIRSPDRTLKPEMFARVTLLADASKRAIRVPTSALITEGLYTFVFVEKEPGAFEKRRVRLSVQQDRDFSYLEEGVAKGERVVVTGPLLLNAELKIAN